MMRDRPPSSATAIEGDRPGGSPDDDLLLSNQLCFALHSAAHAVARTYKPLLDRLGGITYPQYLVLLVLWERDRQTVGEIGRHLHLDSGTLTPLLKRLEAVGLVIRARDGEDERQVRVSLSARAWEMRGEACRIPAEIAAAAGRSPRDLGALRDEVVRLRDALNAPRATDGDS